MDEIIFKHHCFGHFSNNCEYKDNCALSIRCIIETCNRELYGVQIDQSENDQTDNDDDYPEIEYYDC